MTNKIKQQLIKKKSEVYKNSLKANVIDYILDCYSTDEEIKMFMSDLLQHGCSSGMISSLICYSDTIKFYDKYEDDIEELITNNMESLGVKSRPLFIESLNGTAENMTQEKNLLSWFAFEETTRTLNEELEINKDFL